jgi:hypothetical protein
VFLSDIFVTWDEGVQPGIARGRPARGQDSRLVTGRVTGIL